MIEAMSMATKHALLGYDAIQLVAALEANEDLLSDERPAITLVSADLELNDAAIIEGLAVENPDDHP